MKETKRSSMAVLSVRMDAEMHRQLRHYCIEKNKKSLNHVIVKAVTTWWRRQPEASKYAQVYRSRQEPEGEVLDEESVEDADASDSVSNSGDSDSSVESDSDDSDSSVASDSG